MFNRTLVGQAPFLGLSLLVIIFKKKRDYPPFFEKKDLSPFSLFLLRFFLCHSLIVLLGSCTTRLGNRKELMINECGFLSAGFLSWRTCLESMLFDE